MSKQHRLHSDFFFLSLVLGVYAVLAFFWVNVNLSSLIKVLGLLVSFALTIFWSRAFWELRLNRKPQSSELSEDQLQLELSAKGLIAAASCIVLRINNSSKVEMLKITPNLEPLKPWLEGDFTNFVQAVSGLTMTEAETLRFQINHSLGMDALQWEILKLALPRDISLAESKAGDIVTIRLDYAPEFESGKLSHIQVMIQDITQAQSLSNKGKQQDVAKFFAILQVPDSLFELFMSETRRLFDEIRNDLKALRKASPKDSKEIASRLFRAVHTIKANARLFKLDSIQSAAHAVESYLDDFRQGLVSPKNNQVYDLGQKISLISDEVYSYASLRKEILNTSHRHSGVNIKYRVQWIRSLMNQLAVALGDPHFERSHLELMQREFSRALSSFDRLSLKGYLQGYRQMLSDIAVEIGKEIEFKTEIDFFHFDSEVLAKVNDILLHCLRNAIDHGIESPQERLDAGKPRKGLITLKTFERNGMIQIELSDDGRGIDIEKLKAKAEELGIIVPDASKALNDADIIPLLFNVGVSTATAVTQISGRGLGMDVVRDGIYALNGQMRLTFVKGQSTTFIFLIPCSDEDLLNNRAIHDVEELFKTAAQQVSTQHEISISMPSGLRGHLFVDRMLLIDAFSMILGEITKKLPAHTGLHITLEEHLGKRKVDSFVFYRFKITSRLPIFNAKESVRLGQAIEVATELLRRSGGSLYLRDEKQVEINIPSHIPVPFDDYVFKILILSDQDFDQEVDLFFQNIMRGWHYRIYRCVPGQPLPLEISKVACLVLLESRYIRDYLGFRDHWGQSRDGIILFPEDELDIDTLNETAIAPEQIMFVPPKFDREHLQRCFVSIVFRRFLKEMVRDQPSELDLAS